MHASSPSFELEVTIGTITNHCAFKLDLYVSEAKIKEEVGLLHVVLGNVL
jgi:hypothetical protein